MSNILKIYDDTATYYTEVDIKEDIKHKVPTSVVESLNSALPYVIYNGNPKYYTGSCSGCFADNHSGKCEGDYSGFNSVNKVTYEIGFIEWMHNRKTKYLQLADNLTIPVAILEEIGFSSESLISNSYDNTISFDWVQVAPIIQVVS